MFFELWWCFGGGVLSARKLRRAPSRPVGTSDRIRNASAVPDAATSTRRTSGLRGLEDNNLKKKHNFIEFQRFSIFNFQLTNASDDTSIERRRDQRWLVFGSFGALQDVHVEGIGVAAGLGQQFTLLETRGVLDGVVHGWGEDLSKVSQIVVVVLRHFSQPGNVKSRHPDTFPIPFIDFQYTQSAAPPNPSATPQSPESRITQTQHTHHTHTHIT